VHDIKLIERELLEARGQPEERASARDGAETRCARMEPNVGRNDAECISPPLPRATTIITCADTSEAARIRPCHSPSLQTPPSDAVPSATYQQHFLSGRLGPRCCCHGLRHIISPRPADGAGASSHVQIPARRRESSRSSLSASKRRPETSCGRDLMMQ
jgi:hypothetical protein